MLKVTYYPVPSGLAPYIERAVIIDFSEALGARWQFLPTGCFGVTLLCGTEDEEWELEKPEDDGAFSGIAGQAMGTWCERRCVAFGLSLTPLGALSLPIHSHDFESAFAVTSEAMFGRPQWRTLRSQVRDAPSIEAKLAVFMGWMEGVLMRAPIYGRSGSLGDVATLMRAVRAPTVEEAAARVGVHRRQFERDFRYYFGTSPKRYAKVARVQQVAQLSWHGTSFASIAAELGFTDQAHMSHVVRDVTGLSPSALLAKVAASPLAQATRPYANGRITHF